MSSSLSAQEQVNSRNEKGHLHKRYGAYMKPSAAQWDTGLGHLNGEKCMT